MIGGEQKEQDADNDHRFGNRRLLVRMTQTFMHVETEVNDNDCCEKPHKIEDGVKTVRFTLAPRSLQCK